MDFEYTNRGEIIPPKDWHKCTIDSSNLEVDGYVLELYEMIRDCGLDFSYVGNVMTVNRDNETPVGRKKDAADDFGVSSFERGVLPSLELDGFKVEFK